MIWVEPELVGQRSAARMRNSSVRKSRHSMWPLYCKSPSVCVASCLFLQRVFLADTNRSMTVDLVGREPRSVQPSLSRSHVWHNLTRHRKLVVLGEQELGPSRAQESPGGARPSAGPGADGA